MRIFHVWGKLAPVLYCQDGPPLTVKDQQISMAVNYLPTVMLRLEEYLGDSPIQQDINGNME